MCCSSKGVNLLLHLNFRTSISSNVFWIPFTHLYIKSLLLSRNLLQLYKRCLQFCPCWFHQPVTTSRLYTYSNIKVSSIRQSQDLLIDILFSKDFVQITSSIVLPGSPSPTTIWFSSNGTLLCLSETSHWPY